MIQMSPCDLAELVRIMEPNKKECRHITGIIVYMSGNIELVRGKARAHIEATPYNDIRTAMACQVCPCCGEEL